MSAISKNTLSLLSCHCLLPDEKKTPDSDVSPPKPYKVTAITPYWLDGELQSVTELQTLNDDLGSEPKLHHCCDKETKLGLTIIDNQKTVLNVTNVHVKQTKNKNSRVRYPKCKYKMFNLHFAFVTLPIHLTKLANKAGSTHPVQKN